MMQSLLAIETDAATGVDKLVVVLQAKNADQLIVPRSLAHLLALMPLIDHNQRLSPLLLYTLFHTRQHRVRLALSSPRPLHNCATAPYNLLLSFLDGRTDAHHPAHNGDIDAG
jgi:hypothetical protein